MSFHAHVSRSVDHHFIISGTYMYLELGSISKESAGVVVHTFFTLKLDSCNVLLYGLHKYQLQRLQYVQNMVARVVLQMSKFQHIYAVLHLFCVSFIGY